MKIFASILFGLSVLAAGSAEAQRRPDRYQFSQSDGAGIYDSICAGCHMPDARGATGAGTYPSLVHNEKLAASGYPLSLVLGGYHGMPAVGRMLDDRQVADVINYVRTHFGNAYDDPITPEDVKAAR